MEETNIIQGVSISLKLPIQIILIAIFVIIYVIRNRKQWKWFNLLVYTTFLFYLLNVINLTIFPLDFMFTEEAKSIVSHEVNINIIPFYSIIGSFNVGMIQSIWQNGGNLILLFPLGLYLPFIINKRLSYKKVLLFACLVTLTIEVFQGIVGVLGYNHRTVDIDDVLLNTIGCMLGYFIINKIIPMFRKTRLINRFPSNGYS
ncbi:VanZ family protein [Bacillus alkalicellulosilyticus]|uniref:VanZ family protein n=1 Tax=Alkalihalobacterium alkalicellulosilyticum TaxID=1912214 RepID=UPI0009987569|nr:VanZ family protein [Bacillus alkalicellulosilyticus]